MASPLILISGATATGKTDLSLELSTKLKEKGLEPEIINGDSLLFYKEITTGTAKPSQEERGAVPHHLIDIASIQDPLNASDYVDLALPLIEKLHKEKKIPLIVGGSAFYIRALIKGMYESSPASEEALEKIRDLESQEGISGLRALLKERDLLSWERIHPNDTYRTTRALEHCLTHNEPFSKAKERQEESDPYDLSIPQKADWQVHHIYLDIPKEDHWPLMHQRAIKMISQGLVDEVRGLLQKGFDASLKPLQSIGYKETLQFLSGDIQSEEELAELIYIATRRLAKSQKTFFKKIKPKLTYHPLKERDTILKDCENFLSKLPVKQLK